MSSPNLAIPHVAAAQNQKEVTINDAVDALDRAVTGSATIDCGAGGTIAVSASTFRAAARLVLTGGPLEPVTITLPAIERPILVRNGTGVAVTARNPTGADAVEVPDGKLVLLFSTGAGVHLAGSAGGGGALAELSDVDLATPAAGDLLRFDGALWRAAAPGVYRRALLPYRGALLRRTSNLIAVAAPVLIPWQDPVYDTDGFWSAGAPSRIAIPAGVTKVRFSGSVALASSTNAGGVFLSLERNGAGGPPGAGVFTVRASTTGYGNNDYQCHSAVIPVAAGDFFELRVNFTNVNWDDIVASDSRTWFAVEVVETVDAADPPADVHLWKAGAPGASEVLLRLPLARRTLFPAGLPLSVGAAGVAAAAEADFDLRRNGASFGMLRFPAASATATFIAAADALFEPGDLLSVHAPATPDAALTDIGATLAGTLVM